ncbi:hypothetical protein IFM89_031328 [Coptis chinensis]|uniref:Glucose-methanol-choline oxidoreductase N-terminal domain-containing protein n=1 Tax=Coptis chinensis TaxID=261450 RepID=A0A835MJR0_9MAGN|nr:hypothetical protein IFM89_031328 [Coptis chinensis]
MECTKLPGPKKDLGNTIQCLTNPTPIRFSSFFIRQGVKLLFDVSRLVLLSLQELMIALGSYTIVQGHGTLNIISNVEQVQGKSYDYIVVGGGTSGCPLAATLSKRFTVLLVERGGSPFGDPFIMEKKNFWRPMFQIDEFTSIVQELVSEEGVANQRGRVLGGSTVINGGLYTRTNKEYIARAGWDENLVKEAYEWVESRVVFEPNLSEQQSFARDAFVAAGNVPFNGYSLEHVEGTKITGTIFDENGMRHCSAHLLHTGDPERLTVLLNATVKSTTFSQVAGDGTKPRACGIRFIRSHEDLDSSYEVNLNPASDSESEGDVVLSAGAMGSPQILMLSGIGPSELLSKFNIAPMIDAPQVGQDIRDHPGIHFLLDAGIGNEGQADTSQVVGIASSSRFLFQYGGSKASGRPIRVLRGKLVYPSSKGKLELNSTDPRKNPSVRYNYLLEENDLEEFVEMVHEMKKIARSMDSALGTNVGSVVDKDYKVFGVEGLRVVDASALSDLLSTSPMGTLLMLGRYQGIKMLRERAIGE